MIDAAELLIGMKELRELVVALGGSADRINPILAKIDGITEEVEDEAIEQEQAKNM